MAEIRSTMDMVMERAAKLAAGASDTSKEEAFFQDGMRAGASFLRSDNISLVAAVEAVQPGGRLLFKKGLLNTFLRNLVLPRSEEQMSEGALSGLHEMAQLLPDSRNLDGLITELRSILSRYLEHRKQLKEQLEENFSAQIAMLEKTYAQQTGVNVKMSPAQHPKFAEEWQKALTRLNDQYDNAIMQYKDAINLQLTAQ